MRSSRRRPICASWQAARRPGRPPWPRLDLSSMKSTPRCEAALRFGGSRAALRWVQPLTTGVRQPSRMRRLPANGPRPHSICDPLISSSDGIGGFSMKTPFLSVGQAGESVRIMRKTSARREGRITLWGRFRTCHRMRRLSAHVAPRCLNREPQLNRSTIGGFRYAPFACQSPLLAVADALIVPPLLPTTKQLAFGKLTIKARGEQIRDHF